MRQLLLLRHAKSSWDDPALADHARPLNRRGRLAAEAMRQAMGEFGLAPDLVLVSSSRRTLQTLEALEPWPDTPLVEQMDAIYLAPAPGLLQVLRAVSDTVRSVMLIGHNPGLYDLAMLLVGEQDKARMDSTIQLLTEGYPSGALAEFSVPGSWSGVGGGGERLVRFIRPRDLPSLGQ